MIQKKKVLTGCQIDIVRGVPDMHDVVERIINGDNVSIVVTCMTSLSRGTAKGMTVFDLKVTFENIVIVMLDKHCFCAGCLVVTDPEYRFERRRFYQDERKRQSIILARNANKMLIKTFTKF